MYICIMCIYIYIYLFIGYVLLFGYVCLVVYSMLCVLYIYIYREREREIGLLACRGGSFLFAFGRHRLSKALCFVCCLFKLSIYLIGGCKLKTNELPHGSRVERASCYMLSHACGRSFKALDLGNLVSQDFELFCAFMARIRRLHKSPQSLLVVLPRKMAVSANLRTSLPNSHKSCAENIKVLARKIPLHHSSTSVISSVPSAGSQRPQHLPPTQARLCFQHLCLPFRPLPCLTREIDHIM